VPPQGHAALDKSRVGVLVGSGMGGLQVFQDGVKALVEKGYKKITPFFIPYAITNMGEGGGMRGARRSRRSSSHIH
jgi:3-oxoacyl-(acyl-carrier-protein) synthase